MSSAPARLVPSTLAALGALLATACSWIPPDLQRAPIYIYEFATNENSVVNTPILHEIFGYARGVPDEETRDQRLQLAPGFGLSVFATGIPHPRTIRVTSAGDLVVSQPRKGRVLLVTRDADGDGRSDETRVLADDLDLPHGIELVGDTLYFVEPHRILRATFDAELGELSSPLEPFLDLPKTEHHHFRTLRLGPDGWLYYPIGANCNLCEATDPREGALLRVRPDGSGEEVVATGFRNIAGFDWQPGTDTLYANDIGADYQGEDFPPEELNRIETGGFYGFPYAHGDRRPDPQFGAGHEERVAASTPPAASFPAHTTPLGLIFLRGDTHPEGYEGAAVMAFHGSWNKRKKAGYKLVSLHWRADGTIEERDLLTGFEHDEDVIGRPVDVAEGTDGSIYVSDDYAGAIYRVGAGSARPTALAAPAKAPAPEPYAIASASHHVDVELARSGARLFETHDCASCHALGEASTVSPSPATPSVSLAGVAGRYGPDELVALLAAPPAAMPRPSLSPDERRALAAFLLAGSSTGPVTDPEALSPLRP